MLDLKLTKTGRKLIQSLEVPNLTRELCVFTRKDLCFGKSWQAIYEMLSKFSVLSFRPIVVKKIMSAVIIDPDHSFKR